MSGAEPKILIREVTQQPAVVEDIRIPDAARPGLGWLSQIAASAAPQTVLLQQLDSGGIPLWTQEVTFGDAALLTDVVVPVSKTGAATLRVTNSTSTSVIFYAIAWHVRD